MYWFCFIVHLLNYYYLLYYFSRYCKNVCVCVCTYIYYEHKLHPSLVLLSLQPTVFLFLLKFVLFNQNDSQCKAGDEMWDMMRESKNYIWQNTFIELEHQVVILCHWIHKMSAIKTTYFLWQWWVIPRYSFNVVTINYVSIKFVSKVIKKLILGLPPTCCTGHSAQ